MGTLDYERSGRLESLYIATRAMREMQRRYFAGERGVLDKARAIERIVDVVIEEIAALDEGRLQLSLIGASDGTE